VEFVESDPPLLMHMQFEEDKLDASCDEKQGARSYPEISQLFTLETLEP
jgi:hypothetical protein